MTEVTQRPEDDAHKDRRKFLATCGKFAVVTPPAITMLLSTSLHSSAIAHSGGRGGPTAGGIHRSGGIHKSGGIFRSGGRGNNGYGNGGYDGSPNGSTDRYR
jgi:uncharacterized membrane protein